MDSQVFSGKIIGDYQCGFRGNKSTIDQYYETIIPENLRI